MRGLILFYFVSVCAHLYAADLAVPTSPELALPPPSRAPARIPSAAEAEDMNDNTASPSGGRIIGFTVGADANFANNIMFNSVSLNDNGGNYSGSANLNLNAAVGLRLGVEMLQTHRFGFMASVAFEIPRAVTGLNATLSGFATNPAVFGSNPTMQFNLIEIDALYRWHYLYIPIGLNYSLPIMANMNSSFENFTVSGALGGQVGAGLAVLDGLRVELLFSMIAMQLHATGNDAGGNAYNYNFGIGYAPTAELRAHWSF